MKACGRLYSETDSMNFHSSVMHGPFFNGSEFDEVLMLLPEVSLGSQLNQNCTLDKELQWVNDSQFDTQAAASSYTNGLVRSNLGVSVSMPNKQPAEFSMKAPYINDNDLSSSLFSHPLIPYTVPSRLIAKADYDNVSRERDRQEILQQRQLIRDLKGQLDILSSQFHALEEKNIETLDQLEQAESNLQTLRRNYFELQLSNAELLKNYHMAERHHPSLLSEKVARYGMGPPATSDYGSMSLPQKKYTDAGSSVSISPTASVSMFAPMSNEVYNLANSSSKPMRYERSYLMQHHACTSLAQSTPFSKAVEPEQTNLFALPAFTAEARAPTGKMAFSIPDHCTKYIMPETPKSVLSFETTPNGKIQGSFCSKSPRSDSDLNATATECLGVSAAFADSNLKPQGSLQQPKVVPRSIAVRARGVVFARNTPEESTKQQPSLVVSPLRPQRLQLTDSRPSKSEERRLAPGRPHALADHSISNGNITEEPVLELWDVADQGMYKTELCNKWLESKGSCPYGNRCQFAHGVEELRPVLRHPRYKTELCRMVAAGDRCPYGHRCHFRHILTKEEKSTLNF